MTAQRVFISHASEDAAAAARIREKLETRGIACWIAPRDIAPGADYGTAIVDAIRTSRAVVLLLTRHGNQSAFVAREIERAASFERPIYVLRLENATPAPALELFVSNKQWIDAFDGELDEAVERLAAALAGTASTAIPRRGLRARRVLLIAANVVLFATALYVAWPFLRNRPASADGALASFFHTIDEGRDDRAHAEQLSARARAAITQAQWRVELERMRAFLGEDTGARRTIAKGTPSGRGVNGPPGTYALFDTQRSANDGNLCEQVLLSRDTDASWHVERYVYWLNRGPCLGDADLRAADAASRAMLGKLLSGTPLAGTEVAAAWRPYATSAPWRDTVALMPRYFEGLEIPERALGRFALPMMQPVGPGDFVALRYAADRAQIRENIDVVMQRESDGVWRLTMLPATSPYVGP